MPIRPGLYRDRDGFIVEVVSADESGVTVRYSDGKTVTVSA